MRLIYFIVDWKKVEPKIVTIKALDKRKTIPIINKTDLFKSVNPNFLKTDTGKNKIAPDIMATATSAGVIFLKPSKTLSIILSKSCTESEYSSFKRLYSDFNDFRITKLEFLPSLSNSLYHKKYKMQQFLLLKEIFRYDKIK